MEENHENTAVIWFRIPKNGSGAEGVDYARALESALCYGWIDGQKRKQDERYWLQRFTPRRSGSRWSKVNREKATELIGAGRMRRDFFATLDSRNRYSILYRVQDAKRAQTRAAGIEKFVAMLAEGKKLH
ncbi:MULTISPECIES: YdeI family protein [unclassified Streptomyces]|uniref:YdeI/OmpD-associated family protein n=1 Tax=unclassified Streptomyces TaxID=2593676 RepID=UPI003800254D